MKLAILQTALHWELADENRQHIAQELKGLEPVDLVILPEMFTTGFSMRAPALAETMTGPTLEWMQALAQDAQAVLCGSVIMMSERGYTNRLLWVSPLGDVQYYDKRHLFRMAQEHQHYSAGQEKLVTSLAGFNCCPLICYDLRFPVFSRNLGKEVDVLVYVANWPAKRAAHWRALLQARAIENQCYVVGVNRLGIDGNTVAYQGDSMVVDFQGEIIADAFDRAGLHYAAAGCWRLERLSRCVSGLDGSGCFYVGSLIGCHANRRRP